MRKFTFLLSLLLACVGAAYAQTPFAPESGKAYFLQDKATGLYLDMTTDGKLDSRHNASLNTVATPIYFEADPESSDKWALRTGNGEGNFLGAESWNTRIDETSAKYWTVTATEIDGATYYKFSQDFSSNTGSMGYDSGTSGASLFCNKEGAQWALVPVPNEVVTVTFNYYLDGGTEIYTTQSVQGIPGAAYVSPVLDYTTGSVSGVFGKNDETVSVQITSALPFQVSSDESNLVWQAVEPHWNQAAYKWQYDADDVIVSTPVVANNSAEGYSDAQLWAFTGNLIDGFKILNKAAGAGKWLRKNGSEAQVSATDDNNRWFLTPTSAYEDKATNCCFHLKGENNYLNHNGGLKFYNQTDNGSTNRFYAPAYPLNEYVKVFVQAPAQDIVVGQLRDIEALSAIKDAYEKTSANAYDMTGVQELKNAIAAADFTDVNAFDANKYYRLLNMSYADEYMVGGTDTNVYGAERNQLTNLNSVFKFEPAATDGQYYITVNGRYFGKLTTSQTLQLVSADGVRGEYTVVALDGTPKYVFQDKTNTANPDQAYLHHANHNGGNNIVGWGTGASASQWYLVEAKSVKVGLNAVDGKSYSTVYLPFDVEATGNTKAYYAKEISGTGTEKIITMTGTPDNKVKALQGALLMNDAADAEAVLSIVTDAAAPGANLLTGSCTAVTKEAGTVYVFGNGSDGVGFYRNNGNLKANRAYVDGAEGMMLVMKFDGQTTGIIDGVQTEGAGEAPLYDLSGRLVVKAGKGVYIRNGKKIYVK